MKILHVCESIIGGTGSYLAELIPHQVRKYGAENVALLIPDSQMDYLETSISNVSPVIINFARPRRLAGAFHLIGAYRQALFTFRPDVVHAHSSIAGLVVRSLRTAGMAKIAFCPHGWSVDMKSGPAMRLFAQVSERVLALFSDETIVISRHEFDRGRQLGVGESRLHLIPNGIATEPPDVEPAEWNDKRLKVLYAGRLDRQKGVDILLKAVVGLEDKISVRLAGDVAVGSNFLQDEMPSCVEKLGWLDRKDVIAQMKSCDVLVMPSRWEGFGLVAVEAMRLAKPVAASAVGGLREVIGNGDCGFLFPPEDDRALHEVLAALDKEKLKAMGERAYQRFLSAYTSDRMVREIDGVYVHMIGTVQPSTERSAV